MSTPIEAMEALDSYARELDTLSKDLAEVERKLVPVEREYEEFMGAFEEGLWQQHVHDGMKFPPERLRERMAHRAMSPELLGRYVALVSARRRMKDRIGALKASVDAQRSILSALKVEAEASGGGLRRAA